MKVTTSDRLQQIMRERHLKQADILELCQPYCRQFGIKLQKSALSQYVSGKVLPNQYKLTILGYALGVSEAWLMGFDVPRERDVDANGNNLSSDEAALVSLFRLIPEDKRGLVLDMIRAALKFEG